ncbi:MAG: HAMP domain-containing sensor histidine kinase, partial [Pseudomonadota bacterium]|nr:HAMP domain-containing sensor histidine kinase [Pseudomonadota bacterium]
QIESINTTSREIMSGDLSRRIPTRGSGDDFDLLAGNLNAMLDRIQALMEDVRRVSDNIAHDLRTPLARLRNRLELLKTDADADSPDSQAVEQAVAEADGLLATFNALLRIARIEAEQRREAFEQVALDTVVQDVAEFYEPLAEDKAQRLLLDLQPGIRLQGDRDLLFQALANLLDNAIKYTPRGGRIEISLQSSEIGVRLIVADNGPGIPVEAREKVLQRFFRMEESRTTPGNGLGLSLVAAVAKLHGITIRLEDNRPGLRVVWELPGDV